MRKGRTVSIRTHDLAVIVLVAVMPHTCVFSVALWDPHLDRGWIQLLVQAASPGGHPAAPDSVSTEQCGGALVQ